MKYAKLSDHTYALRLERGDDIHDTIQNFCADQNIANATVEGVGSVESPALAHYSIDTKQFTDRKLQGIYEITSLLGNVALVENNPFAHLHVTVSDLEMRVLGGHLVKGECSATLELIIRATDARYTKSHDEAIGLKVWDF